MDCISKMASNNRNRIIYHLWMDIQDVIGPARLWPYRIRALFWTRNLNHFQRILIAAFVWVNGLNPVIFMEWAALMHLCRDRIATNHFIALFRLFESVNYRLYAYNVTMGRYEYLDGQVRTYVHRTRRERPYVLYK